MYKKLSTEDVVDGREESKDELALHGPIATTTNVVTSSLLVVGLVTFIGDCSRGVLFPVLWPVCERLGGTTLDLGYLIALFSAGRFIISAPLGWLADRYGHKFALIISGVLFVCGSILWARAITLPVLYAAQLLLGLGTGSLGVTRAYVSEQTLPAERTNVLSIFSALQYAGFAAMPLVGSLFVAYGQNHANAQALEFPAYCITVLALLCLILTIYPLQDLPVKQVPAEIETYQNSSAIDTVADCENPLTPKGTLKSFEIETLPKSPVSPKSPSSNAVTATNKVIQKRQQYLVFIWMIFLNFSTRGAVAVYETQLSRLFLDTFHLSELQMGLLVSGAGLLGTLQLLFYKQLWTTWQGLSDYFLMLLGLFILVVAQAFVIIWADSPLTVGGVEQPQQQLWQVVVALYLVYGLGYPMANAAVLGCFSKLQRDQKQGVSQSLFALMGSLARVIVPITSGYAESFMETSSSFGMVCLLILISLMVLVLLEEPIIASTQPDESETNFAASKTRRASVIFFCVCSVGAVLKTLFD
jgi:ceroid-lipofuscinosis MFS transporter 7